MVNIDFVSLALPPLYGLIFRWSGIYTHPSKSSQCPVKNGRARAFNEIASKFSAGLMVICIRNSWKSLMLMHGPCIFSIFSHYTDSLRSASNATFHVPPSFQLWQQMVSEISRISCTKIHTSTILLDSTHTHTHRMVLETVRAKLTTTTTPTQPKSNKLATELLGAHKNTTTDKIA